MSQFTVATSAGALPPSVPTSFETDVGTATPEGNILFINAGNSLNHAGATVRFTGMDNVVQLDVTDGQGNTLIGEESGFENLGASNTALGFATLHLIDNAISNTAIGHSALSNLVFGFGNTTVGDASGENLSGGSYNTLLGYLSGTAYSASENNNVVLGPHLGVPGESNTTRIGSSGGVAAASTTVFIYGIYTKTVAPASARIILGDSTSLLGSLPNGTTGQVLTATTGALPSWQSPSNIASSYVVVTFAMSPYTVTTTDYYIAVNSSGGAVTINLPDAPTQNRQFIIKDSFGNANANNITVKSLTGVSTIDGQASFLFNDNYESLECLYHNGNYEVF